MSLPIYKPNAANKGSAFTFNFGPAKKGGDTKGDLALYVSTVLQATWNPATKQGTFKENAKDQSKTLNMKLNEFEVGGLINSIQRRVEFKGYHTFPGGSGSVQFSFTPSEKEGVFNGFVFSILRSNDKAVFRIGIGPHEAVALSSFLDFGLKRLWQNRFNNQFQGGQAQQQTSAPKQAAKSVEKPVEEEGNPFGDGEAGDAPAPEQAPTDNAPQDDADVNPFG